MTAARVSAAQLKAMLGDGGELALLDVREEGEFAESHMLFAVPLPLSQLELRLGALVPRRTTRVVLTGADAEDRRVGTAAARLARFGYGQVSVLDGGLAGWAAAGYERFGGVHVPSKAFGEVVEHAAGTPRIEPEDLARLVESGADLVILDSRPAGEFQVMSIPGAINVPGGELVYRIRDLAPNPETTVIVNCAGRTRSIIGAQSLINAGVPNRVMALKNGTMGWHLAGLALDHGSRRGFGAASAAALAWARAAAADVGARAGVRPLDPDGLARLEADRARTVVLLDVRDPAEFLAGHHPRARSAPGGQLVQATDAYVGVRNATLVLLDDDGARATMAASWLIQMGWPEVYVLPGICAGAAGPQPTAPIGGEPPVERIPADALAVLPDATVIDVGTSLGYRAGHIPGAAWAIRARLPELGLPGSGPLVVTSADGVLASLAAADLAGSGRRVAALDGGTAAWTAAGRPLEAGMTRALCPTVDVWYKPYDRDREQEAFMRAYLAWEVDLTTQIARDGDARFRVLA